MNDLVYGGIVKFAMSLTRAVVERRLDRDADNAVKDPRAPVACIPALPSLSSSH
jgi:hypothetical protein